MTYSIMLFVSHFLLLSLQCKHSLWYNLLFSHSSNFSIDLRVLLLRQTTGHILQPNVQQQHRQPQRSHRTFTGRLFFTQLFTLFMLALNSSGATFPVNEDGNSASNLLLSPNTVTCPDPRTTTGSGLYLSSCSSRARSSLPSSSSS